MIKSLRQAEGGTKSTMFWIAVTITDRTRTLPPQAVLHWRLPYSSKAPKLKRVRHGSSSHGADEGSLVGDDRQVQTHQLRRQIETVKTSCRKSSEASSGLPRRMLN
jgi:hypothetical protein